MNDMVERVTRAIEKTRWAIAIEMANGAKISSAEGSRRSARAAIEAMREPTETMRQAMLSALARDIHERWGVPPKLTEAQLRGDEPLSDGEAAQRYMHIGANMRCSSETDAVWRAGVDEALR